eukprot:1360090-Amphidinium_carterae.1
MDHAMSAKRRHEGSGEAVTMKASAELSAEWLQHLQPIEVPGDGDCGWHALDILCNDHTEVNAQRTLAFKASILHQTLEARDQIALLLGCRREGVDNVVEGWRPKGVWADLRTLLVCGFLHATVVIVVSPRENVIEVASPFGDPDLHTPVWIVRYEANHYTPMRALNIRVVRELLGSVRGKFKPWKSHPYLPGGVTSEQVRALDEETNSHHTKDTEGCHNLEVCTIGSTDTGTASEAADPTCVADAHPSHSDADDAWPVFEEDVPYRMEGTPNDIQGTRLMTLNLGSWRAQCAHVEVIMDEEPTILCLQETGLTADGQKAAERWLLERKLKALFSPPCILKESIRGRLYANKGEAPGLMIVYGLDMEVYPREPRSKAGSQLLEAARLMICAAIGPENSETILVNVYAPSGPNRQAERDEFFESVWTELSMWAGLNVIVGGDWNELPPDSVLAAHAMDEGWRIPPVVGHGELYTYECAEHRNWLDSFMCSPKVHSVDCQSTREVGLLKHRAVVTTLPHVPNMNTCRVVYPPTLNPGPPMHMASPVDWEKQLRQLQSMYANMESETCNLTEWDRTHIVQEIWGGFEECYRKHLLACHDISDAEHNRDTVTRLGALQPMGSKCTRSHGHDGTQLSSDARLHKHLNRFVAMTTHATARCLQRIRRDLHFICEELQITANELDHWLQAPSAGAEAFQLALDKRKARLQNHAIAEWKRRHTDRKRNPTSHLYAWIRGKTLTPSLAFTHENQICQGPDQCFTALRQYWTNIHKTVETDTQNLHDYQHTHATGAAQNFPLDPNLLCKAAKAMRTHSAAGLDGWSVHSLKMLTPLIALVVLWLFKLFTLFQKWPLGLLLTRIQMIPKFQGATSIAHMRPIAILSVWYRLWSRYQLWSLDPRIVQTLHTGL